MVGSMYEEGTGVEQNYSMAVEWYTKASNQNHGMANYYLGNIYFSGKGVERDYKLAFQCYKAASDEGDDNAMSELAYIYYYGMGVEKDYEKAISLFSQVSNRSDYAMTILGYIYHSIDNGIQKFSKALRCYTNTKVSGDNKSYALRGIGLLYEYGDGMKRNYEKALEYYRQSADKKNKAAYYNLGLLYYYGKGVKDDFGAALKWLNRVIEEEPRKNFEYIFVQLENDDELNETSEEQKKYSIVSEMVIYGAAHYYLGLLYKNGQGVDVNHEKALEHFKIAHLNGVKKAQQYIH